MYPIRPITLVVGYPPGGGADFLARNLALYMAEGLGQKVIIENRAGAAGSVGAASVARAVPDGYTLYLATRPVALHKTMYRNAKYDFFKDFVPVGMVASVPYVLVSGKHVFAKTLNEAILLAHEAPGTYTCASGDIGSTSYLLCEALHEHAGMRWLNVPYQGDSPALMDVIGKKADYAIATGPSILPHVSLGSLRALSVFSGERAAIIPAVPCIAEHGYMDAEAQSWFAVMAPAGTPPDAIARLNSAMNEVLSNESVRDKLTQLAYMMPEPGNTPEALAAFLKRDARKWAKVVERRRIRLK